MGRGGGNDIHRLTPTSDQDERPRAYVVQKPDTSVTGEDIMQFMDKRVARHKRLVGGVVFIDVVPKNPSGKILRKELRERAKKELEKVSAKL